MFELITQRSLFQVNLEKFGSEIQWIQSKVPVAVEMLIDIKDIIDLILVDFLPQLCALQVEYSSWIAIWVIVKATMKDEDKEPSSQSSSSS